MKFAVIALALQWVVIFWQLARIRKLGMELAKLRLQLVSQMLKAHYLNPEVMENTMITAGPLLKEMIR